MRVILFLFLFVSFSSFADQLNVFQRSLLKHFDTLTTDMKTYEGYVDETCSIFPEGELFPYTFPAIAYVLLDQKHSEERAKALLQIAEGKTEKHMGKELLELKDYQDQATFLGQLNLALSIYLFRYENDEFKRLNNHLSAVLVKAFKDVNYAQINSYPSLTWSFDSIPALLSIKLNQSIDKKEKDKLVEEHLNWLKTVASDKLTQLPYSVYSKGFKEVPRGCDLSFRLPQFYFLDKDYAQKSYKLYCQHFWKKGVLSGFREYQDDSLGEDVDSGPIIFGVGATATALAYPCFELFDDTAKKNLYLMYLSQVPMIKTVIKEQKSSYSELLDKRAYTGLFFGDCTLFYALTFHHLDELLKAKKLP